MQQAHLLSPSLVRLFVRETAAAFLFAGGVAVFAGAVGFAFWFADITLVQADVFADGPTALLASALPAFFAAWGFFLLRKIAWSGPGEAFAVAATCAGFGVVAHRNVLLSRFFEVVSAGGDALSAWVGSATGLMPRQGAEHTTLVVEVVVVVVVALSSLGAQRWIVGARAKRS